MKDAPAHYFTGPEWVNRDNVPPSPWPMAKKKSGDKSRQKSGQTAKALMGIRKLERMGLLK